MKTAVFLAAMAALSLGACNRREPAATPQGSDVAAAMPDTATPRTPNQTMTAPDAGVTGTAPANGSPPAVAPTPPTGTAGGSPGIPGATATLVTPGNTPPK
jgi:hypothetical protein